MTKKTIISKQLSLYLTKRELFACQIMAAFSANDPNKGRMICDYRSHAALAVERADELIEALARAEGEQVK